MAETVTNGFVQPMAHAAQTRGDFMGAAAACGEQEVRVRCGVGEGGGWGGPWYRNGLYEALHIMGAKRSARGGQAPGSILAGYRLAIGWL